MSDSRGIGTRREGKEPIKGHASSSPETAVATGIQEPGISNVEEAEEGLESGGDSKGCNSEVRKGEKGVNELRTFERKHESA
ncbi:hypothetical protein RHMOL_Rhmol05G0070900 [Rhododendron molle]|uniref:Uncharacterized protein n=1 Tax=Rhododendron molle TaxID=49168 RepID=A0ACC0NMI7_RHOML|nr:hypothetical protein RHMOL_Rhmol05G0070900 [Rhododendron molle]